MGHGGKRAGAGRSHKTGPTSRYRIVKKGWEWRHAVGGTRSPSASSARPCS